VAFFVRIDQILLDLSDSRTFSLSLYKVKSEIRPRKIWVWYGQVLNHVESDLLSLLSSANICFVDFYKIMLAFILGGLDLELAIKRLKLH
tara:strand:+ start:27160 stop:27429 length:270 start_codon:yes stop_codon:yes gene_type:complete